MGDVANNAKVAQLREFAGRGLSDAELRRTLVRASGDINRAASLLLLEKPSSALAQPVPASTAHPSLLKRPRPAPVTDTPSPDVVRKAAWVAYYKAHYVEVLELLGAACDRHEITARITDMWKNLSRPDKEDLYARARDRIVAAKAEKPDAAVCSPTTPAPAKAAEAERPAPERNGGVNEEQASVVREPARVEAGALRGSSDAELASAKTRVEATDSAVQIISDDEHCEDSAKDVRAGEAAEDPPRCAADDDEPLVVGDAAEIEKNAPAWPKLFATRIALCLSSVSGVNILRAGQAVTLVPSGKIVRFAFNGREIGRLPSDLANKLAPTLEAGYVDAVCRVIEVPKVLRPMKPLYIEVGMRLQKHAFLSRNQMTRELSTAGTPGRDSRGAQNSKSDKAVGGGKRGKSAAKGKNSASLDDDDDGIDKGRVAVADLFEFLSACEPPAKSPEQPFPKDDVDVTAVGGNGAVTEGDANAYFNSVRQIEGNMAEYVHPSQLTCDLREYQKIGVSWMCAREKNGSAGGPATDAMLHPLWKRRVFPDKLEFFLNGTTGGLSLEAPLARVNGPFCGILADEMGLGKTVECIATIVLDRCELDSKFGSGKAIIDKHKKEAVEMVIDVDNVAESKEEGDAIREVGRQHAFSSTGSTGDGDDGDVAEVKSRDGGGELKEDEVVGGRDKRGSPGDGMDVESDRDGAGSGRNGTVADSDDSSDADDADDGSDAEYVVDEVEANGNSEDNSDGGSDSDFIPYKGRHHSRLANSRPQGSKRLKIADSSKDQPGGWIRRAQFGKSSHGPYGRIHAMRGKEHLGETKMRQGGTLLVVPMSMIGQWLSELEKHVETGFLRCWAHHEQRGRARQLSVEHADVVVTTYGIVASEAPEEDGDGNACKEPGPLFQVEWRRIVLDEAHNIKGRTTKNAKSCFQLRGNLRWCVTGSPIQNHINDVQPLLRFMGVEPWSSWTFWQRGILSKMESSDAQLKAEALSTLRDILTPLTLRRMKSTLGTDGKPLVHLVPRKEEIVRLEPGKSELDFYETLHSKSQAKFNTFVKQGKVLNKWANVLELLLRLRQACCHPYLVFAASQSEASTMGDRAKMFEVFANAGSKGAYADKVLSEAEAGSASNCPICLCSVEEPTAIKTCSHSACRDCLLQLVEKSRPGVNPICHVCRTEFSGKEDLIRLPRPSGSRFPMDIDENMPSSAKLEAVLQGVREMEDARRTSDDGTAGKTVVMSQFTSFLDLVGIALEREGVKFLRFDGTLASKARGKVLNEFASAAETASGTANVLLVSIRSGSVGLNLTSASLCILTDPSWNPMVDAQAAARVHRHGQTRPVVIRRLVIANSVEERLLQVQERKLDVTEGALSVATAEDRENRLEMMKLLFS